MRNSIQRFDETVEDYLKYRPLYPEEVYLLLVKQFNLTPKEIIADIGAQAFCQKYFLITVILFKEFFYNIWNKQTNLIRLVTSFDTTTEDIDHFIRLIG